MRIPSDIAVSYYFSHSNKKKILKCKSYCGTEECIWDFVFYYISFLENKRDAAVASAVSQFQQLQLLAQSLSCGVIKVEYCHCTNQSFEWKSRKIRIFKADCNKMLSIFRSINIFFSTLTLRNLNARIFIKILSFLCFVLGDIDC